MTDIATKVEADELSSEEILEAFGVDIGVKLHIKKGWLHIKKEWMSEVNGKYLRQNWSHHNMQDALDLFAAVLPGWLAIIWTDGRVEAWPPQDGKGAFVGYSKDNPAWALEAAAYRAVNGEKT